MVTFLRAMAMTSRKTTSRSSRRFTPTSYSLGQRQWPPLCTGYGNFCFPLQSRLLSSPPSASADFSNVDGNDHHRKRILDSVSSDDYAIVEDTLDWLSHVVIGFNLCPFAKPSFVKDQIHIQVVHGENPTDVLAQVVEECWKLKQIDNEDDGGTTLVVCPDLFPDDFEAFLGIYNVLEEGILIDTNLTEELQVAPFHPLFVFGDQAEEETDYDFTDNAAGAIGSYTNRSPYPIFHILREMEVSKAVEALEGDSSRVWKRNIDLLQSLEEEFSASAGDSAETEPALLRSAILKGKINENVKNESMQQSVRARILRVMTKFKKDRIA